MAQYLKIHQVNPQQRLLERAVAILREGGVVAYPTDSHYALGCAMANKAALERIRRIRQSDERHDYTLVCRDLSEIATYARVDNQKYRLLRSLTPGAYTFIFEATHEVPKRLRDPRKRSIGIRVPQHPVALGLLEALGEPIMSATLQLPGDELPLSDPDDIRERLDKQVDAIVDGGVCGVEPTTILDLSGDSVEVLREGKGDVSFL